MFKIIRIIVSSVVFIILPLKGCAILDTDPGEIQAQTDSLRILALGDSYTIGESVPESERWPVQLADSLQQYDFGVIEMKIVARTGWTTSDLLRAMSQAEFSAKYDLAYYDITLLSRSVPDNPQLIASDNLHLSGKMYTKWVKMILPGLLKILNSYYS